MSKANIAAILGIITIMVSVIGYGIVNRPVVGYKMEDTPDVIYTFYSSGYDSNLLKQDIFLDISNSGNTDANLILDFNCKNATISNETIKPYMTLINNNEVQIHTTQFKNSPSWNPTKQILEINKSSESFSCNYNVLQYTKDNSVSGIVNRVFGEVHGYYPTYFNYKKVDNNFVLQK